jgi:hypothetical protein
MAPVHERVTVPARVERVDRQVDAGAHVLRGGRFADDAAFITGQMLVVDGGTNLH